MPSVPPHEVAEAWSALGQQLASCRKGAGYTQESFAPLANYGRSTIANVETGRQRVGRDFWARCDELLHTGDTLVDEYDRIQLTVGRRPTRAVAVPRQPVGLGSSAVDVVAAPSDPAGRDTDYLIGEWNTFSTMTSMLAQQRQAVSPSALLGLVEAHRDCLSTLFRKAGRAPVRDDIGAMLAEASIVASRLWSAQGNRALAVAHCAYARQLGDRLGNVRISATARIFESNLHSEAATLIEADGDIMIGLRLLYEATRSSDDLRLSVYAGTCHLLLGNPQAAISELESTVDTLESDHANANVFFAAVVDLASAYAEAGELERACTLLGSIYDRLKAGGNYRGIARAQRARERLARWRSASVVLELEDRMTT